MHERYNSMLGIPSISTSISLGISNIISNGHSRPLSGFSDTSALNCKTVSFGIILSIYVHLQNITSNKKPYVKLFYQIPDHPKLKIWISYLTRCIKIKFALFGFHVNICSKLPFSSLLTCFNENTHTCQRSTINIDEKSF